MQNAEYKHFMPMFFFQFEVFQLGFGIPKTQKKKVLKSYVATM